MKITEIEYGVRKVLGVLTLYSIKVPCILSPDNNNVYYLYIEAASPEDARERICEIRPELCIYKGGLEIRKCLKKVNGEIIWDE